jgi:hypothetical protein
VEIIDNVRHLLKDDLTEEIQPHVKLSIAAAYFSMYAFSELKKQLNIKKFESVSNKRIPWSIIATNEKNDWINQDDGSI